MISDVSESFSQATPVLSSVTPATAAVGSTIALRGAGFSAVAQENIVWLGTQSAMASKYTLLSPATSAEIEEIQTTVPSSLAPGTYNIIVQAGDNLSNNNISLTVTP